MAPLASCNSRMSLCASATPPASGKRLSGAGQAAVGADQAQFDAARRRVHQAAAADAARRAAADDVAVEPAVAHVHAVDGARARPHPRANAPAFKRRAGRGGRADDPLRRPHHHLAVRADVEERARPRLLVQARGHDAAEQVAADESAQAGQEFGRPRPSQLRSSSKR